MTPTRAGAVPIETTPESAPTQATRANPTPMTPTRAGAVPIETTPESAPTQATRASPTPMTATRAGAVPIQVTRASAALPTRAGADPTLPTRAGAPRQTPECAPPTTTRASATHMTATRAGAPTDFHQTLRAASRSAAGFPNALEHRRAAFGQAVIAHGHQRTVARRTDPNAACIALCVRRAFGASDLDFSGRVRSRSAAAEFLCALLQSGGARVVAAPRGFDHAERGATAAGAESERSPEAQRDQPAPSARAPNPRPMRTRHVAGHLARLRVEPRENKPRFARRCREAGLRHRCPRG